MELVFILAISLLEMFRIHLFKVVEIVRAFRVYTLMQDKKFPVLFGNESVPAVRTAQGKLLREAVLFGREVGAAYFAAELSGFAIIAVEIKLRSTTGRTMAIIRDVAGFPPGDRLDLLAVTVLKERDEELPVPLMLMKLDSGKFIDFKFLVFRGMGIIKCPLLEWDGSADKI